MKREEQIRFCQKCLNRKMDMQQGLLCNLTGKMATFQTECPDFKQDETVKERPIDDRESLLLPDLEQKLSPEIIEKLRGEQRLIPAILVGLVMGLLGATIWGYLTVTTGFQIGYMALAIGAGVGFTIRIMGNGIDPVFGYWGAGISLFSVLLGNFFSVIGFLANATGLEYAETLLRFDFHHLPALMAESFSPIDLVFYGIAVFEGYKFSFRPITEKQIAELRQKNKW